MGYFRVLEPFQVSKIYSQFRFVKSSSRVSQNALLPTTMRVIRGLELSTLLAESYDGCCGDRLVYDLSF